ncbi:hypothetical protein [Arthrobacter sp. EpRS71]|uniref:hypothetical protein n=1 Tax=Arthrobacter sp. EpRS71 TaxID=1743141 RepID=UPI00074A2353|nr:hypothetical protein [Arthrobacter sp. EpRS71]KUM34817.1 hypothetical protein AR689_11980 [Arthrobacter sp. EpRS71]
MAGTLRGPAQRRDLHFHAAAALRAEARRLHRQVPLAAVVSVRRRALTVGAESAAVGAAPAVTAELL